MMHSAARRILLASAALVFGGGFLVARLVGRSSASAGTGVEHAAETAGTAAIELQLGEARFNSLSWTVTNGAFSRMGSVDGPKGAVVRFLVAGLPAGTGFTLALVGTRNGDTASNCIGTAGFDVVANGISPVVLSLVCGGPAGGGRSGGVLAINGSTAIRPSCAAVTALSASPAETIVGGSMLLTASAMSGAGSTAGLSFSWNVTGGTGTGSFTGRSSATPTFTCTQAGPITVAVTATTGSGGACANTMKYASVVCDPPRSNGASPSAGPATSQTRWWWSPSENGSSPGAGPALLLGNGLDPSGAGAGAAAGSAGLTGGGAPGTAASPGGAEGPSAGGGGGSSLPGSSPCAPFNNPPGAVANGCTPTEQRFVDKSAECYTCLVDGSCLDDVKFGDTGKECGDLTGQAAGGASKGTSNEALCLAVVDCILTTTCASPDVTECYCGSLLGVACATSTKPGDGACAQIEAEASGHRSTDPASTVSPLLADVNLASGKAGAIFHCGNLNGCEKLCSL